MEGVRYLLGLVTLLLAVAGGVFLFQLLGDEDRSGYFRVHIEFRSAEGLMPGADVKYRGVLVGSVRDVTLRDDGDKAIASIVLEPGRDDLARTNSKFWVVTPRFGGITTGASGLETLVRDAYVSFFTPEPQGPKLANGSHVAGLERPWDDDPEASLDVPRRGDLSMTLLVPENHNLVPGSTVRYRGVETGEVRRIELAADGSHVRIDLRIDRRFRRTVTDRTEFWVARPRLSGALLGGISLEDMSALLVPFVSYYTPGGEGLPVSDGWVVAAEVDRPDIDLGKVTDEHRADTPSPEAAPPTADALQMVQVIYEAVETDWFSPDDQIRREGTGLLYEDAEGRLLVLTARSLCDASYFERDLFGTDPDIAREGATVVLPDGTVLRGAPMWTAPEGVDLALIAVDVDEGDRSDLPVTPRSKIAFDAKAPPTELEQLDSERKPNTTPLKEGAALPPVEGHRGALAVHDDRVVGILGQAGGTDVEPRIVDLSVVPVPLRPSR